MELKVSGPPENSSKQRMRQLFNALDVDNSGTLSFNEIMVMVKAENPDANQEEIKMIFSRMDDDGSGEVNFDEFYLAFNDSLRSAAATPIGSPNVSPGTTPDGSPTSSRLMSKRMSLSKSSFQSQEEIKAVQEQKRALKFAFDRLDQDCSGDIGLKEIVTFVKERNPDAKESDIKEVYRRLDKDGDGSISFNEFYGAFSKSLGSPDANASRRGSFLDSRRGSFQHDLSPRRTSISGAISRRGSVQYDFSSRRGSFQENKSRRGSVTGRRPSFATLKRQVTQEGKTELTEEEKKLRKALKENFKEYSTDGQMDKLAFITYVREKVDFISDEDAERKFEDFDLNGDGDIDFSEFVKVFSMMVNHAIEEKKAIEKNYEEIDQIFSHVAGSNEVISISKTNELLEASFGCKLPPEIYEKLEESLKHREPKGVTRMEFKDMAKMLLSTSHAPKVIQCVYGKKTENTVGFSNLFGEGSESLQQSMKNQGQDLDDKKLLGSITGALHMSENELLDQVTAMKQHERQMEDRLRVVQDQDQKIMSMLRSQLKNSEMENEKNRARMKFLEKENKSLKNATLDFSADQIKVLEAHMKAKDTKIANLQSELAKGISERDKIFEHLQKNQKKFQEYDTLIIAMEQKYKEKLEELEQTRRVVADQESLIHEGKKAIIAKTEEIAEKHHTLRELKRHLKAMQIQQIEKEQKEEIERGESLAAQFEEQERLRSEEEKEEMPEITEEEKLTREIERQQARAEAAEKALKASKEQEEIAVKQIEEALEEAEIARKEKETAEKKAIDAKYRAEVAESKMKVAEKTAVKALKSLEEMSAFKRKAEELEKELMLLKTFNADQLAEIKAQSQMKTIEELRSALEEQKKRTEAAEAKLDELRSQRDLGKGALQRRIEELEKEIMVLRAFDVDEVVGSQTAELEEKKKKKIDFKFPWELEEGEKSHEIFEARVKKLQAYLRESEVETTVMQRDPPRISEEKEGAGEVLIETSYKPSQEEKLKYRQKATLNETELEAPREQVQIPKDSLEAHKESKEELSLEAINQGNMSTENGLEAQQEQVRAPESSHEVQNESAEEISSINEGKMITKIELEADQEQVRVTKDALDVYNESEEGVSSINEGKVNSEIEPEPMRDQIRATKDSLEVHKDSREAISSINNGGKTGNDEPETQRQRAGVPENSLEAHTQGISSINESKMGPEIEPEEKKKRNLTTGVSLEANKESRKGISSINEGKIGTEIAFGGQQEQVQVTKDSLDAGKESRDGSSSETIIEGKMGTEKQLETQRDQVWIDRDSLQAYKERALVAEKALRVSEKQLQDLRQRLRQLEQKENFSSQMPLEKAASSKSMNEEVQMPSLNHGGVSGETENNQHQESQEIRNLRQQLEERRRRARAAEQERKEAESRVKNLAARLAKKREEKRRAQEIAQREVTLNEPRVHDETATDEVPLATSEKPNPVTDSSLNTFHTQDNKVSTHAQDNKASTLSKTANQVGSQAQQEESQAVRELRRILADRRRRTDAAVQAMHDAELKVKELETKLVKRGKTVPKKENVSENTQLTLRHLPRNQYHVDLPSSPTSQILDVVADTFSAGTLPSPLETSFSVPPNVMEQSMSTIPSQSSSLQSSPVARKESMGRIPSQSSSIQSSPMASSKTPEQKERARGFNDENSLRQLVADDKSLEQVKIAEDLKQSQRDGVGVEKSARSPPRQSRGRPEAQRQTYTPAMDHNDPQRLVGVESSSQMRVEVQLTSERKLGASGGVDEAQNSGIISRRRDIKSARGPLLSQEVEEFNQEIDEMRDMEIPAHVNDRSPSPSPIKPKDIQAALIEQRRQKASEINPMLSLTNDSIVPRSIAANDINERATIEALEKAIQDEMDRERAAQMARIEAEKRQLLLVEELRKAIAEQEGQEEAARLGREIAEKRLLELTRQLEEEQKALAAEQSQAEAFSSRSPSRSYALRADQKKVSENPETAADLKSAIARDAERKISTGHPVEVSLKGPTTRFEELTVKEEEAFSAEMKATGKDERFSGKSQEFLQGAEKNVMEMKKLENAISRSHLPLAEEKRLRELIQNASEEAKTHVKMALDQQNEMSRLTAQNTALDKQLHTALDSLRKSKSRLNWTSDQLEESEKARKEIQRAYRKERSRKRSEGWMPEHVVSDLQKQAEGAQTAQKKIQQLEDELKATEDREKVMGNMLAELKRREKDAQERIEEAEAKEFSLQQKVEEAVESKETLQSKLKAMQEELKETKQEIAQTAKNREEKYSSIEVPTQKLNEIELLSSEELKEELKTLLKRLNQSKMQLKDSQEELQRKSKDLFRTEMNMKETEEKLKDTRQELEQVVKEFEPIEGPSNVVEELESMSPEELKEELKNSRKRLKHSRIQLEISEGQLKHSQKELFKTGEELRKIRSSRSLLSETSQMSGDSQSVLMIRDKLEAVEKALREEQSVVNLIREQLSSSRDDLSPQNQEVIRRTEALGQKLQAQIRSLEAAFHSKNEDQATFKREQGEKGALDTIAPEEEKKVPQLENETNSVKSDTEAIRPRDIGKIIATEQKPYAPLVEEDEMSEKEKTMEQKVRKLAQNAKDLKQGIAATRELAKAKSLMPLTPTRAGFDAKANEFSPSTEEESGTSNSSKASPRSPESISTSRRRQKRLSEELRIVEKEFISLKVELDTVRGQVETAKLLQTNASEELGNAVDKEEGILRQLRSVDRGTTDDDYYQAIEKEAEVLNELQKVQEVKKKAHDALDVAHTEFTQARKKEEELLSQLNTKQATGEEKMRMLDEARKEELIITERVLASNLREKLQDSEKKCAAQAASIEELQARLELCDKREASLLAVNKGDQDPKTAIREALEREKEHMNELSLSKQEEVKLRQELRIANENREKLEKDNEILEEKLKKAMSRAIELELQLAISKKREEKYQAIVKRRLSVNKAKEQGQKLDESLLRMSSTDDKYIGKKTITDDSLEESKDETFYTGPKSIGFDYASDEEHLEESLSVVEHGPRYRTGCSAWVFSMSRSNPKPRQRISVKNGRR
mmetsp:Transcript_1267/g.1780  ORF Transcript_1267/g.1780 Transcript_1267/m.1780 type:complete len:3027 (+) Transcript_1267:98-9178(+)